MSHFESIKSDMNVTDNDGKAMLHLVSQESTVQILIDAKCDLNCKDNHNKTPLQFHSEIGNGTVCQALLRNGAKLDEVNKEL